MIGERYLLERNDKGELVNFLGRREFKDEESFQNWYSLTRLLAKLLNFNLKVLLFKNSNIE